MIKPEAETIEIVAPASVSTQQDSLRATAHVMRRVRTRRCNGGINRLDTEPPEPAAIAPRDYAHVTVLVILDRKTATAAKRIVVVDLAQTEVDRDGISVGDPNGPCPPYP